MALKFKSWPGYKINPSQNPLLVTAQREDAYIISIRKSEIDTFPKAVHFFLSGHPTFENTPIASKSLNDLKPLSYVTLLLRGLHPIKAKFLSKISEFEIIIDLSENTELITGTEIGVINFNQNYYVEVRYLDKNDNPIINHHDHFYAGPDGNVIMDISTPSSLITPSLEGKGKYLSTVYKAEYRESYDGNRDGDWQSMPFGYNIELTHASNTSIKTGFTDSHITKRFVRGYPLIYSYIIERLPIKEAYYTHIVLVYTELTLQQTNPYLEFRANQKEIMSIPFSEAEQKVYVFEIPDIFSENFHKDTVFIRFDQYYR